VAVVAGASAQNIVLNSDFSLPAISSTDFPDWTVTGAALGVFTGLNLGPNTLGTSDWITCSCYSYQGIGYIYQTLNTTPGATYTVSFLGGTNSLLDGGYPNRLAQVYFDGSAVLDFSDGFTAIDTPTLFSTTVTATSSSSTIGFYGFETSGWWDVDDVSVVKTNTTPSPAAALSFAALALCRRRNRRAN
jgi:hypothetical protein